MCDPKTSNPLAHRLLLGHRGLKKYLGKSFPSLVTYLLGLWWIRIAKFVNRIEDVCGHYSSNRFGRPKTLLKRGRLRLDLFAKIGLLCYCDKQQKIVSLSSTWLIAFLQDRGHQHDSTIRSQRSFISGKVSPLSSYKGWDGKLVIIKIQLPPLSFQSSDNVWLM